MKIILLVLTIIINLTNKVFAYPVCTVCTVAVGASLGIAKRFGVKDTIIGIWLGALLIIMTYWTINFFDKKKWNFKYRNQILLLLSFSMIGLLYINQIKYNTEYFFIDPFLFSSIIGAILYVVSQKFYQYLKIKNNNHAHFPFEKVICAIIFLLIGSLCFNYI